MEFITQDSGIRLDQFLYQSLIDHFNEERYSRSLIQKWVKAGAARVFSSGIEIAAKKVKPALLLDLDQKVQLTIPKEVESSLQPAPIDFEVLFEDESLAVIIKPAGLTVHPANDKADNTEVTLLHGILHRWPSIDKLNSDNSSHSDRRPGIVHRLDKPTEGVMMIAKTKSMQWQLSRLFQKREVEKKYLAWLIGSPSETEGRIEAALRRHPQQRLRMQVHPLGRMAITEYKVLDYKLSRKGRKFTKVEINLLTGRTHQIRAHFSSIGCPVVGDNLYSSSADSFSKYGLMLLSEKLSFVHPLTQEKLSFEAKIPSRFIEFEQKCIFY